MAFSGELFIGALNERDRFFNGSLEDVRLWRRALSDEEIAAVAAGKTTTGLDDALAGHWTKAALAGQTWNSKAPATLSAKRVEKTGVIINKKYDGYRGIWYFNQPSNDEYVYKYSGGLGTYCAKHIPHAWYVKEVDKTFFTYGGAKDGTDNRRLVHMVSYYDHKTGQVPRPTILLDKETDDAHDNPVINVDDKGYVWIFSSSHGTGRPSYISRSKKPYCVEGFDCVWTGNYSYPQPWFFPGKGFLLIHTYYTKGRTNSMMTSADGVNWSPRRFLSRIGQGHYQVSRPWKDKKVGTAFNYHPDGRGLNWRTNLYYMETPDFGETWTNVKGEPLEPMLTDVKNPALVKEYESQGLNVYMKDITYDDQGRPIILYVTSKGYESGPKNMPRTWTTARWTGTEWDIQGGDIVSDNNYDTGSVYVEAPDQWRIIGPTHVGPQPFNPGGEVAMWVSSDQGKHWKMLRQMTKGSDYNHTYVRRPVNAHPGFYAFWADGHGRKPSDSRLYFCNKDGDVFRLPVKMTSDMEKPMKAN
ncbi:MAG: BNR-4 repeat-containing protein [Phycisphaerae bacterium]|nr:BNR-4 repeat-containing protein [Phycisphaerae bacterium]